MENSVLLITNIPAPYRVDLYKDLQRDAGLKFYFFFFNQRKKSLYNLLIDKDFLLNRNVFSAEKIFFLNCVQLIKCIITVRPKIIINAGFGAYHFFLLPILIIQKTILINWWGGTELSESRISWIKKKYRSFVAQFYSGSIFYSNSSKEYFQNHINQSLSENKFLLLGNFTLNTETFRKKVEIVRVQKKVENRISIVTIGFQHLRKNTIFLLEAFNILKQKFDNIELEIIGNGPELEKIFNYVKKNKLEKVVHLNQFIPHNEIYRYYSACDILVHPSLMDQWPQVFNEAACVGLPMLLSQNAGVENHYTETFREEVLFDPNDINDLTNKLERMITDTIFRNKLHDLLITYSDANKSSIQSFRILRFIGSFIIN